MRTGLIIGAGMRRPAGPGTRRLAGAGTRRLGMTVVVALAVALIGLAISAGASRAAGNGPSRTSQAAHDVAARHNANERFDFVDDHDRWPLLPWLATGIVFPDVEVILTVPKGASLTTANVHVFEMGKSVAGTTVTPIASDVPAPNPSTLGSGYAGEPFSRFVVSYVSQMPLGTREVELGIHVDGVGYADVDYNAPPRAPALVVLHPNPKSFWGSATGLVVIGAGAGLLLALAMFALIAPRRRRAGLRRRVGEFTATAVSPEPTLDASEEASRPLRFVALERLLDHASWWGRFRQDVEIAAMEQQPIELVAITAMGTVAAAAVIFVAFKIVLLALLAVPLGVLTLRSIVKQRLRRTRAMFGDQLAPHLEELASTMRAGHGLISGLTAMVRTSEEPSKREWGRVLADEQLGMPLEIAMRSLATRMACDEVEQVALVASLHSRTGGNMAEVLDRVAEGVRERSELRRELHTLTSQARLSRWVVTAIPPVLFGVILLIDPRYLRPLFTTTAGIIALTVAIALDIAGMLVMRAFTEIEV